MGSDYKLESMGVSHDGFSTLLIGLAILHITSFCWGIRLANKQYTQLPLKKHVLFFLLVLLNGFITFSCHQYKSIWFGFSFYYIPSASMHPTLKAGDVSLVDTWAYNKETPNKNDILVFRRSPESNVLVKRLTRTKIVGGETQLFMTGDKANQSIDSRSFGWVSNKYIIGKVRFVLFSTKEKKRRLISIE